MKTVRFILICAWLFAMLDWHVIAPTRFQHREWLEWMHTHEREYAFVTRTVETIVCTPAMALKPIFVESFLSVEASQEAQDSVRHAPRMDWYGFYHLPVRGQSWTFVSWASWFSYWLSPSILWFLVFKRIREQRT